MQLPWPVSIALGLIVFVGLRWIVPALFAGDPIRVAISNISRTFVWFALIAFSFFGLMAFLRTSAAVGAARLKKGIWIEPPFDGGRGWWHIYAKSDARKIK
jgi:hypothetical protein